MLAFLKKGRMEFLGKSSMCGEWTHKYAWQGACTSTHGGGAHTRVSPRVNPLTCTSVHWSVWKPKLHIFPLASDPCKLTIFLSSIFHILCGWDHVATQLLGGLSLHLNHLIA